MILPNYTIIENIAESRYATIYKAYHKSEPDRLLILKVLKSADIPDYKKSCFKQRIKHLSVIKDPYIITPVLFGEHETHCFITYDYFDGVPLNKLIEAPAGISLDVFFTIACKLAQAMDKVHAAGIIHNGIKPHNILVRPDTLDIRLIDFISTIDVRDVSHFIYDLAFIRGTLSYTLPEQTGRISHKVVFSSDLYSLGVVFYEMLTGRLPFLSEDPLELIHSHLAEEAPLIHRINPGIPRALSNVIAKLLLKDPEKRCQSAKGLLNDLIRCRAEYTATGSIREFPPSAYFMEKKAACLPPDSGSPAGMLPNLDVKYLMKYSLAISAEIEQEALIKRIMNVIIESSGAQHGYLLTEEEGVLYIRAASHVSDKQAIERVKMKLDDSEDICRAIVRYVYRTGEKLVLNNASQEGLFTENPQVQRLRLRSVLCLPVLKQAKLIGIIYLENRLADAVFTAEKTQMTELLTSQAAISLDNARLVEEIKKAQEALRNTTEVLEMRVRERTEELAKANLLMAKDIAERKLAEESLRAERQRFNNVLDMLPSYLVLLKPDYHIAFANRVFRERFGESRGLRCFEHLFGRSGPCENCQSYSVLETGEPINWEWQGPDDCYYLVFDYPFTDVNGSPLILEIGIDITDHKKAELEIQKLNRELEQRVNERTKQLTAANRELYASRTDLQTALHDKEILLREIHHRVKNNLQIIHSMLNLQLPYIKDEQAIEFFKESQNRIFTMALIHENLYRSESLAKIDLYGYIQNLTTNLFYSYGVSENLIKRIISVENLTLNIDTVIPCALIINELVSNSLKHAFPQSPGCAGKTPEICIDVRQSSGDEYILTVSDNGIGLPPGFEIQKCESLGLKLVNVLVNQLKGTLSINTGKKTEFTIAFRELKRREKR